MRAIFVQTHHVTSRFLALWVQKLRNKLNLQKTKVAMTCSFEKVIRTLAFRSREKFDNSFYFKIIGIV